MKRVLSVLAAAMLSTTASAQTTPPPSPAPSDQTEVKLVGCIQTESDYRRAQDKGRGGAAGTGVGAANEFILTNASMAEQGLSSKAGTADVAYELTGANEGSVKDFVGKRVEITGKLEPAETSATGRPTGGATAGRPPTGVDIASQDLKLRELNVVSVKAATGTCQPM